MRFVFSLKSVKAYLYPLGRLGVIMLALALGFHVPCSAEDLILGNFTGASYGNWKATGTAFNPGPASGPLLSKLEIENALDAVVASSEVEGDRPTGTLTSPTFTIARDYISFRIGGGDYEHDTCLNLPVDGRVVKSATGWRSDRLAPASWEVRRFRGRDAQIQIVDAATGDWGHINVFLGGYLGGRVESMNGDKVPGSTAIVRVVGAGA
jgi:fructan beta-fructosidase